MKDGQSPVQQATAPASEKTSHGGSNFFCCGIECHIDAVRPSIGNAAAFLRAHGVNDDELTGCELAMVEACNNAILYVTDAQRHLPIGLQIISHAECVEIQVTDHTAGFDWPEAPVLPEAEVEHGRGLFIIRTVMDTVFYLRSTLENRLVMRKRLTHSRATPRASALASAQITENRLSVLSPPQPVGARLLSDSKDSERNALRIMEGKPGDPVGEIQQQLALSQHVITTMAGELCHQIINSRIQKEDLDNRLLAHELEIARNIQQSLLPKTFPSLPGFTIGGYCLSARQVGGDFYDVMPLADGSTLLVVADVMGKGVPAALFAATLRTLLRTIAEWTHSPAEILARANRLMHDELSAVDMFITAQLLLVNHAQMTLASAGHCPLLCIDSSGEPQALAPDGMPLGIVRDCEFTELVIPLESVGCALLYTDGLTEARNAEGSLFGHQRLLDWLKKGMLYRHSPTELTRSFLEEMRLFQSPDSLKDDQTFLVLTRLLPLASLSTGMSSNLGAFAELNLQAAKA